MTNKAKKENKDLEIKAPDGKYFYAIGKRKTAVAKIRIYKGEGNVFVNGKAAKEYFDRKTNLGLIKTPLKTLGAEKKFDIYVLVKGGGINSQAEAIRHGIARSLLNSDPLSKLTLKKEKLLTRDPRKKERKKPGLKRARKAPQFSKR